MAWKIIRDLLYEQWPSTGPSAVGVREGVLLGPTREAELFDDDGELYFVAAFDREAEEVEDGEIGGLYDLYRWGMMDSGTTDLRIDGASIFF